MIIKIRIEKKRRKNVNFTLFHQWTYFLCAYSLIQFNTNKLSSKDQEWNTLCYLIKDTNSVINIL